MYCEQRKPQFNDCAISTFRQSNMTEATLTKKGRGEQSKHMQSEEKYKKKETVAPLNKFC